MNKVKKFKAESFDIMQYFYGAVHEPLIHCLIDFSGHVDEDALKKAVTISARAIPLIQCCFNSKSKKPYWEYKGFNGEDMIQLIEGEVNTEDYKDKLLGTTIDISSEPQLKIIIIREKASDTLCIIINHMICDGAGFKEYLYLLSDLYKKCKEGVNIPDLEFKSRGTKQIFGNFTLTEKLSILSSKDELSKQKNELVYKLQGDKNNPIFGTIIIGKEELKAIKNSAKLMEVTINDIILTAYIRVLHRKTRSERIILPCPVDLRKYLKANQEHGICNLTSNYISDVNLKDDNSLEEILMQVSKQMKQQKSGNACLKPVMMLEIAMKIMPFHTMKKLFNKVFTIPVVSFTNLGVMDKNHLNFGDEKIKYAYLTGAVKYVPYFQISVSTYDDECTLSCNLYGTGEDRKNIDKFLGEVKEEIMEYVSNNLNRYN